MKEKPVYLSKTVIGAGVSLLVAIFAVMGYEVDNLAEFQENITAIVTLTATTALTVYGRFNATSNLVIKQKKNDENSD